MIRVAAPDEWPRFKALRLRALATDPAAFGSTLAREEAFPDDEWRRRLGENAVFVSDDWAGTCTLLARDEAEIVALWVAPEARGRGLAAALLRAACEKARRDGRATIHLWSNQENAAALRAYERLGFRRTGEPFHSADGRVFVRLDKSLTER